MGPVWTGDAHHYTAGLTAYRRGDTEAALESLERGLESARRARMTVLGPGILGALAHVTNDPVKRRACLEEGETLLAGGSGSGNYPIFCRHAVYVSLQEGEWHKAERYADLLEGYIVEPWPYC